MKKRTNYYQGLAADYSRPGLVEEPLKSDLIALAVNINKMQEKSLPASAIKIGRAHV